MDIERHDPPQPGPTFTLELGEHDMDLIGIALDMAGDPNPGTPDFLDVELRSEMDRLYSEVISYVEGRTAVKERLGIPE